MFSSSLPSKVNVPYQLLSSDNSNESIPSTFVKAIFLKYSLISIFSYVSGKSIVSEYEYRLTVIESGLNSSKFSLSVHTFWTDIWDSPSCFNCLELFVIVWLLFLSSSVVLFFIKLLLESFFRLVVLILSSVVVLTAWFVVDCVCVAIVCVCVVSPVVVSLAVTTEIEIKTTNNIINIIFARFIDIVFTYFFKTLKIILLNNLIQIVWTHSIFYGIWHRILL